MIGRYLILVLSFRVGLTRKVLHKPCPRYDSFPRCMYEPQPRTLWCDMSNYESLDDLQYNQEIQPKDIARLYLNDSCLNDIQYGKLAQFANITLLKLDDNRIERIPKKVFKGNTRLRQIDLNVNAIRVITKEAFHGLEDLETLNMDDNEIPALSSSWLRDLRRLRGLSMSKNRVRKLTRHSCRPLRRLTTLNLRGPVNFYVANYSCLSGTANDKENHIDSIDTRAFEGLSRLQTLHLDGNQLKNISDNIFHGLKSLRILTLSSNRISQWTANEFPMLHQIDLSSNGLSEVAGNAFESLCYLKHINLSNNGLTQFNHRWLSRTLRKGNVSLDMTGNDWECRCEAVLFQREVRNLQDSGVYVSITGSKCANPSYARDRYILDRHLGEEIQFRAGCEQSRASTLLSPAITTCPEPPTEVHDDDYEYSLTSLDQFFDYLSEDLMQDEKQVVANSLSYHGNRAVVYRSSVAEICFSVLTAIWFSNAVR